jgi:hypothetical protein
LAARSEPRADSGISSLETFEKAETLRAELRYIGDLEFPLGSLGSTHVRNLLVEQYIIYSFYEILKYHVIDTILVYTDPTG